MDAATGRLAREKTEAQKQYTALILDINRSAIDIQRATGLITTGVTSSPEVLKDGIKLLDEVIAAGGLDKLKADLDRAVPLRKRVIELQPAAREWGWSSARFVLVRSIQP